MLFEQKLSAEFIENSYKVPIKIVNVSTSGLNFKMVITGNIYVTYRPHAAIPFYFKYYRYFLCLFMCKNRALRVPY